MSDILIPTATLTLGVFVGVRWADPIYWFFDGLLDRLYDFSQVCVWRTALWQTYAVRKFKRVELTKSDDYTLRAYRAFLFKEKWARQRNAAPRLAAYVASRVSELEASRPHPPPSRGRDDA